MSRMVRTQIYLPRDLYDRLQARRERDGTAMAEQIREAVRKYVAEAEPATVPLAEDDPLWDIVGAGEGPPDGSHEHDAQIYLRSAEEA